MWREMLEKYSGFSEAVVECSVQQELKGFQKRFYGFRSHGDNQCSSGARNAKFGTDLNHKA
jgi:hypothetical protein